MMDIEDGMYIASMALVGLGLGLHYLPAGLVAVGVMLAVPPMLSLLRGGQRKDERKKPD
jgi:hypothetical protein